MNENNGNEKKNNNNNIDNIQASLSSLYDRSTHDNDDWELSTKQKRKKNFSELGKKKNHNNSNWTILIEFFYLKKHLFHDNDLNTIRLLMNMNLNRKFWFDSTKKKFIHNFFDYWIEKFPRRVCIEKYFHFHKNRSAFYDQNYRSYQTIIIINYCLW